MNKLLKVNNNVTLILGSISIAGIIFTNVFFLMLWNKIITIGNVERLINNFSIPVALVYIVFGFFHLSAILTLILQLNFFKRDNFLRAFLFFSGITSLLMLFGDVALLNDISKEYTFGFPSEFYILLFSQALHLIFYVLMIILLVITRKSVKKRDEEIVIKDDSIFINVQYIGILSGISGLVLITVFSILYSTIYLLSPWALRAGITVTSLVAVIPYILIILYWLVMKLREKISEWYDEKQYQDLTKSSLVALVVSIIFLLVVFVCQYIFEDIQILSFIWFPAYFFFILLLFSVMTLFFNKQD